jgi:hypothetical protein
MINFRRARGQSPHSLRVGTASGASVNFKGNGASNGGAFLISK